LRGSFDHLTDRKAVHVLSAFASDAALILAHQELGEAPDEIVAVPKLMADLGVTGVLFPAQTLRVSPTPMRCIARETGSRRPLRPATPCWSASRRGSESVLFGLHKACGNDRPLRVRFRSEGYFLCGRRQASPGQARWG
jgi:hypothetical protein